jgi:uncharacterized protein
MGARARLWLWTAAVLLGLCPGCDDGQRPRRAAPAEPYAVLVFTRTTGFRHASIADGVEALQALGAEHGFRVQVTEDAGAFTDASLATYRAVVFLCTTGDVLDEAQQAAFERYIRAGNGFAGVHSASDTEYGWPWYQGLVGATFADHPPIQSGRARVVEARHPSTAHLPPTWERVDEWYNFRDVRPGLTVLLEADERSYVGGSHGEHHPMAWYHAYDGGRAWYTAFGHTPESYRDAAFRQHLLGGLEHAAGVAPR